MLIFKELILLAFITLVIVTVHAGHKRIIIKVPQRTRHIYHHHVKKVPVYVILPENKPKVVSDFENLIKSKPTTTISPCKDLPVASLEEYSPQYRQARFSYGEKDSYHPDWIEDRDNKGAFVQVDAPKNLDREFQPPPPVINDQIYDYRAVNNRQKNSKKHVTRQLVPETHYQSSKSVAKSQHYGQPVVKPQYHSITVSDTQYPIETVIESQYQSKLLPDKQYYNNYESDSRLMPSSPLGTDTDTEYSREREIVHYAFPPTASGNIGHSANSYASSYQYRIEHRMDDSSTTVT